MKDKHFIPGQTYIYAEKKWTLFKEYSVACYPTYDSVMMYKTYFKKTGFLGIPALSHPWETDFSERWLSHSYQSFLCSVLIFEIAVF